MATAAADTLPLPINYKTPIPDEGIAGLSDGTKAAINGQSQQKSSGYLAPPNRVSDPGMAMTDQQLAAMGGNPSAKDPGIAMSDNQLRAVGGNPDAKDPGIAMSPSQASAMTSPVVPSAKNGQTSDSDSGYLAPPNRAEQTDQTSGYVAPPNRPGANAPAQFQLNQFGLSNPSALGSTGTIASENVVPDQSSPEGVFQKILQVGPKTKEDVYAAHASRDFDDDTAMAALKGLQATEQAKNLGDIAKDRAQGVLDAAKGIGETVGNVMNEPGSIKNVENALSAVSSDNEADNWSKAGQQLGKLLPNSPLLKNVGEFFKSQNLSNESPSYDLAQFKAGNITKEELDQKQAKYGAPTLPDQATDPKMAGDWENVLTNRINASDFLNKYNVQWEPPKEPPLTPEVAAAKRDVASGIGGGEAQFANNAWWAAGAAERAQRTWMPFFSGLPSGINPQIQESLRNNGIYVPSGKPFTQMTQEEIKSELLTQSAKRQSQEQTMQGNPQNIGQSFLPAGTPSVGQIEAQGGKINPQAIAGGTFLSDPTMALWALPGVGPALGMDSIMNPAVWATLKGAGKLTEATGNLSGLIAKGIYKAGAGTGDFAARFAPRITGTIGRTVGALAGNIKGGVGGLLVGEELGNAIGRGLGYVPFVREGVRRTAEAGINTLGDLPNLLSMAAKPTTDGLLTMADDVKNGTSILSQKGLWPNLIGRGAESFTRGAFQMTPYAAATSESPEQFGQTVGTGAALHMAMGGSAIADRAVRNNLFDSAFIRNQGTGTGAGQTLGAKPFNYGTDPVLDQSHASAMSEMGPEHNQIMNDTRQLMRGAAEIYGLKDGDYQQKLLDLQKKGLQNPDLNSQGVAIDPYPGKDQSQVFVNTKFFDKAFLHEALGHAIDNTLSPADKQSVFDLASQNQDPNKFALDYTNRASGGKVSSDYDSLPSQAGQISGQQQWAPGLEGMTKESIQAEMRADAINSLANGRGIRDLTSDPGITRRAQMALGSFLNKMGIDPTTEDARSIMGFKPSFTTSLLLDQLIRNQFTEKGAKTPLQTPGTTKPPYVPPPPKPPHAGVQPFEPVERNPEVIKDQVTQAFRNNHPEADPDMVQQHLSAIDQAFQSRGRPMNFGDMYTSLEKYMYPASEPTEAQHKIAEKIQKDPNYQLTPEEQATFGVTPENPNIIKPGPIPDMVKEHLMTVGTGGVKFTPEEADQFVSPNAKTFVGGLKAAIQAKKIASAPTSSTVQGPIVQPTIGGAPTSGTVPPAAPSVAPTIAEDQKATQVPTTTAVEANPHVQAQLRSEGYDPGHAQQIAKGGIEPGRIITNRVFQGRSAQLNVTGNEPATVRYKNPSGMWDGPSASKFGSSSHGVLSDGNHIANFDTYEQGAAAQFDLLNSPSYSGMSIGAAIDKWTGHTGGSAQVSEYANSVARSVGLSPEDRITPELLRSDKGIAFAKEMAKQETGRIYPMTDAQWKEAQKLAFEGDPNFVASAVDLGKGMRGSQSPGEQIVSQSVPGQAQEAHQAQQTPPAAPTPIKLGEPQPTVPEGTMPDVRRTEESPILPEDISQARENAVANIPAGKKSPENLADQITAQVAKDVGTQHSQRLAPDDNRVTLVQGDNNRTMFSGQHFVPGDAFHQWLLQGVGDHSKGILGQIEQAIANKTDLHIDYGSAPKAEIGTSTGATRAEELAASTPQMRAKGETEAQTAGKNVMPSYVGVSLGKKGEPNSVFYGGPSPDKIASNAGQLIQRLGPDSPYKAGPFGDVQAKEDLQGYLHNVTNGWKGDGSAQLEASPNAQVPTPPPDFVPYELAKKNADFWNLSTQGKGAGAQGKPLNKSGEITSAGKARELAEQNKGFKTDEGITNPLHQKIEQETPGWVDKNLHSGWEMLRADLTKQIHDNPEEAAAKIHPGHEAVAQALNKEGVPPSRVLKAGFMPGDIVENPKGEVERIKSPAVRYANGKVYTGAYHGEAEEKAVKKGEAGDALPEQGFTTSSGRFINRNEAWTLAKSANQLRTSERFNQLHDALEMHSEDLKPRASYMPGDIVENAKGEREKIRAAAVKVGGKIFTGWNHAQAMEEAEKEGEHPLEQNTGFLTSSGKFIDRNEAWKLARDTNQLVNRADDETLHSEQVQSIKNQGSYMPGETKNSIGADVRTAKGDKDEPEPGQWMVYPNTSGHIRAGDFEKKYGVKLSKDPDKTIHPMAILLGPRHQH